MRNFTLYSALVIAILTFTSCEVTVYEQTPNVQVQSISKIDRTYYETNFWGQTTVHQTTDYEILVGNIGGATAHRVQVTLFVEDHDGWIYETEINMDYLSPNYQESFIVETGLNPNQIYGHDVRVEWSH